jgi:hypothetical protein
MGCEGKNNRSLEPLSIVTGAGSSPAATVFLASSFLVAALVYRSLDGAGSMSEKDLG